MKPIAIGCLRLATVGRELAEEVIEAAVGRGVSWFDTADVYGPSAEEGGEGERMLAGRAGVTIVSKGGLVRSGERWMADGRAGRLREAVVATTERLGRRPDVYLLHAVDRKVKLATSVRALVEMKERGEVGEIGICNVSRGQVEEALQVAGQLWAVQVELNAWELGAVRGGLMDLCEERGIWLMAHRPLGGVAKKEARQRHPQVAAIAEAVGCSVEELMLAWLARLSPRVVAVPGVTKVAQVESVVRAARMEIGDDVVREVSRAFGLHAVRRSSTLGRDAGAGAAATSGSGSGSGSGSESGSGSGSGSETGSGSGTGTGSGSSSVTLPVLDAGEIVVIMGMPASGKTTRAREYEQRGYERLNRDDRGGTLSSLARALEAKLKSGVRRVVLDNTYASRADRGLVIEIAGRYGVPVSCEYVAVSMEQAQRQAVLRMLSVHGRALEPAELVSKGKTDPSTIPPRALFAWQRAFEAPALEEGFVSLREISRGAPAPSGVSVASAQARNNASDTSNAPDASHASASGASLAPGAKNRPALILEIDELVWRGRPERASEMVLVDGVNDLISGWREAGWAIAGTLWRPRGERGELVSALCAALGFELPIAVCAHEAGPPVCWCRKPLPAMGLWLAKQHGYALEASWHLGRGTADRGFAARVGCGYLDASAGLSTVKVP